jgi:hypothetical protein
MPAHPVVIGRHFPIGVFERASFLGVRRLWLSTAQPAQFQHSEIAQGFESIFVAR